MLPIDNKYTSVPHLIPEHLYMEVELEQGKDIYILPYDKELENRRIIGLVVRRRNNNEKSYSGKLLASSKVLKSAFITIKIEGSEVQRRIPLDLLGHSEVNEPGTYGKIFLPNGLDTHKSTIKVSSPSDIVENEVIELCWITDPDSHCKK